MDKWVISQDGSLPLYQEIMLLTEEKIKSGELAPGTRLPSERKLADALDVNRSTVIRAMEELTAQGVLIRKKGSGTYVNPDKWGLQTKPLINWGTSLTNETIKRKSAYELAADKVRAQKSEEILDLSRGVLSADLLPELKAPQLSWKELVQQEKEQTPRNTGIHSLRESVQSYLKKTYDMTVPLEEIMITSGTQNALFLISQGLLKPGDAVGIEAPSYFYSLRLFQAAGLRIVPIPMDAEGMTVKGLQEASVNHPLKMVFLNPIFQNPTGLVMSAKRKSEILDYCLMKRIPVVEDDAYGGLSFDSSVENSPLKKRDRQQQVIYLGTLSKLAGHHLRIGWMIGPPTILKELAAIRLQTDSELSFLPQFMADHFLRTEIDEHQDKITTELQKRARSMEKWLRAEFGDEIDFQPAKGGFHLYCRFPDKTKEEVDDILRKLLEKNIIVSEGQKFGDQMNGFRLSFVNFREDFLE
ncbi:DNA-binding transcriptional regulator, MocR family, contains an aminotransferase domain [Alkalibacterium subtropicum]|uniref:DNA-binding transcriptional regulator, MocR family, contains an aminotransferase domain n=1 Tax=Alkalibacterium subtropicum TaxID=753702 RepID=A0A1I1II50_9LACT|nr:PLP-dependent aminotransferase family protein [Alkalibacterium subtropicum]SFC33453.1 DNA-binding transcriptional regulator, MocR family, contains an aminotransferase domain [Alkalibacterium subtropicum]